MKPNSIRQFAFLQNIRVVSFNVWEVLVLPASPKGTFRLMPGVRQILDALHFLGYRLAAYANTRQIKPREADTLQAFFAEQRLDSFEVFWISSMLPARALHGLAGKVDVSPVDILHVGVDLDVDVNAALAVGMRAAWLAPDAHFKPIGGAVLIRALHELLDFLRFADTAHLRLRGFSREVRDMIASLRGLPHETCEVELASEKAVGPIMLNLISKLVTNNSPIETLRACWAEIVSDTKLWGTCVPEKISSQGVLSVHCANPVLRAEFGWQEKRILQTIQERHPRMGVKKLRAHV